MQHHGSISAVVGALRVHLFTFMTRFLYENGVYKTGYALILQIFLDVRDFVMHDGLMTASHWPVLSFENICIQITFTCKHIAINISTFVCYLIRRMRTRYERHDMVFCIHYSSGIAVVQTIKLGIEALHLTTIEKITSKWVKWFDIHALFHFFFPNFEDPVIGISPI